MPHKSQKRVHGKDSNIAVDGMKELFSDGRGNSNAVRESENEANSEVDASAFNSSFQSETSDYDQEDIMEPELEDVDDVDVLKHIDPTEGLDVAWHRFSLHFGSSESAHHLFDVALRMHADPTFVPR